MPGQLDASDQTGIDAGGEHVVDGLHGDRSQALAHTLENLLRRCMRMVMQPLQHGKAWRSDSQVCLPQLIDCTCLTRNHNISIIR